MRPARYSELWVRLLREAKVVKPVTLHGARHGAVTRMIRAGVPLKDVQRWHGHSNPAQTLAYAHADTDDLRLAGDALAPGQA